MSLQVKFTAKQSAVKNICLRNQLQGSWTSGLL